MSRLLCSRLLCSLVRTVVVATFAVTTVSAAPMTFTPTELSGWSLHTAPNGHYFYLCNKVWCGIGSTVAVSLHKEAPRPLDGGTDQIRATILAANPGKVADISFGPVKSGENKGLVAAFRTYHITNAPGAVITDAPHTQYGYVANPALPLTVSIVSSATTEEMAAKNFAVFVDQALTPLARQAKQTAK